MRDEFVNVEAESKAETTLQEPAGIPWALAALENAAGRADRTATTLPDLLDARLGLLLRPGLDSAEVLGEYRDAEPARMLSPLANSVIGFVAAIQRSLQTIERRLEATIEQIDL